MILYCRVKKRERTLLETRNNLGMESQIQECSTQINSLRVSLAKKKASVDKLSNELKYMESVIISAKNKSGLIKVRNTKLIATATLNSEISHLSRRISLLTWTASQLNQALIMHRSSNSQELNSCQRYLQNYENEISRLYLKNVETFKRIIEVNSMFTEAEFFPPQSPLYF